MKKGSNLKRTVGTNGKKKVGRGRPRKHAVLPVAMAALATAEGDRCRRVSPSFWDAWNS
jgi:hypothetical protein